MLNTGDVAFRCRRRESFALAPRKIRLSDRNGNGYSHTLLFMPARVTRRELTLAAAAAGALAAQNRTEPGAMTPSAS